jgi:hypothetical protein
VGFFLNEKAQYSVLQVVLILAQFAVAGLLVFDRHWREVRPVPECLNAGSSGVAFSDLMPGNVFCYCSDVASTDMQDVPDDPTGELDKVQKFVMENLDICKWVSLGVVLLEVSATMPRNFNLSPLFLWFNLLIINMENLLTNLPS